LLPELDQPRKSVQFSEAVQVKTVEEPQDVEINEEKIDRWGYAYIYRIFSNLMRIRI
jgi:hypothetical protein